MNKKYLAAYAAGVVTTPILVGVFRKPIFGTALVLLSHESMDATWDSIVANRERFNKLHKEKAAEKK